MRGARRLVRPGAKQADPLSEQEVLSALPSARKQPSRLVSKPEITGVKVTAGPVLVGPARTTVVRRASQRSPSPVVTRTWRPVPLPCSSVGPGAPVDVRSATCRVASLWFFVGAPTKGRPCAKHLARLFGPWPPCTLQ
ncbi:unnamed protein product, partial [Effrenium voratum]